MEAVGGSTLRDKRDLDEQTAPFDRCSRKLYTRVLVMVRISILFQGLLHVVLHPLRR
jgi:hypothetical protein